MLEYVKSFKGSYVAGENQNKNLSKIGVFFLFAVTKLQTTSYSLDGGEVRCLVANGTRQQLPAVAAAECASIAENVIHRTKGVNHGDSCK